MFVILYLSINLTFASDKTSNKEMKQSDISKLTFDLPLNADERAWLSKHPEITMGGAVIPPFDFFNKKTNRSEGFALDFITLIGQALGIKINYVSGSWSEILNLVKDKKIDGIRMIAKTKATEKYLSFSDSFGASHFSLITRNNVYISSLKQFANKPLGVITHSP